MENFNNVKGEVSGSFLLGISQSFANLNIFTENVLGKNIESINPTEWYPYYKLIELLNSVKTNYSNASESILFRAGVNFIKLWYEQGPGKHMIHSGMDWLYANSESQGYNSVVRGENKNEIGWCNIKTIDEKRGIVVYENVTPLPSDLIKGIFYGGCFLFDDMEYVYIELREEEFPQNSVFIKIILTLRFRVKSKTQNLHLESKISKMQFDDTFELNSEEYESLFWQYKYLKFKNEINKAYFKELSNILRDVTNKSLIQSKKLEELNATKDKFFSIIAHDLRSPFNAILGFSEILSELVSEKNYDDIDEYATIIHQSSIRVTDLLMNLMEWSQSQTGRIEFNPVHFEMVHLIDEIKRLFINVAMQKSISITEKAPPEVLVYADEGMVSTILRNLISNAIKFTKQGGEITISIVEKNEIIVSVSDTGVGIPKTMIDRLFKIDQNYSTTGTCNEKGTGLGLILCQEFVQKHGGKIWVESEEGKGSVFYFTIPNKQAHLTF
jgi:two-component system sensor histidine kinase/response regulator